MVKGLLLAALLGVPSPVTPSPPPMPACMLMIQMANVGGAKITPENVGKLFGAALTIRLKGRMSFTAADLDASAKDLDTCFKFQAGAQK